MLPSLDISTSLGAGLPYLCAPPASSMLPPLKRDQSLTTAPCLLSNWNSEETNRYVPIDERMAGLTFLRASDMYPIVRGLSQMVGPVSWYHPLESRGRVYR
jgi:hypothetical protein